MARTQGRLLPFRIPIFRIFYSTTYTVLFLVVLILLAITPGTLLYTAIENKALQSTFMIGGVYILTAVLAILIYSNRLYTNRTVLAAVGKAYIPVEKGEVGKKVRKLVVGQLERSALVAWESRPRDLAGEILAADEQGSLSNDTMSVKSLGDAYTVGAVIPVDPVCPPWGHVKHEGWSSPSQHNERDTRSDLQYMAVIVEMPNLIEAKAVSLAPADPTLTAQEMAEEASKDPVAVELLMRLAGCGVRGYLEQLASLGVVRDGHAAQDFLRQYEEARFSGRPRTDTQFKALMSAFASFLTGMTELAPVIISQLQASNNPIPSSPSSPAPSINQRSMSMDSKLISPVTSRTRFFTPQMMPETPSRESFTSVIRSTPVPDVAEESDSLEERGSMTSRASAGDEVSEAGSVIIRSSTPMG